MTQSVISVPFSFNASGGISYTQDEKKIWQDRVLLVVMTTLKERIMRPTFGTSVSTAAFQPEEDALALIKQQINIAFSTWLTSLTLVDVVSTVEPSEGTIYIDIVYKYGISKQAETVTVKTALFNRVGELITEVNTNG